MALANVACILAQRCGADQKVLLIDWDLEAPGLHRYFGNRVERRFGLGHHAAEEYDKHPGLIEFFNHIQTLFLPESQNEEPTQALRTSLTTFIESNQYIIETDIPRLSLLKAGAFDKEYASRINQFDWNSFYTACPWSIQLIADALTEHYRYVLIDSRTGITDTSGICTMLLPEKLVLVFTPNRQSLDGVLDVAEWALQVRRNSDDLRALTIFPLPSRIETSEERQLDEWRKAEPYGYQPRFEALFRKIRGIPECDLSKYFEEILVQHSPTYAYGEKIAVLIEQSDTRIFLRSSYITFASKLIGSNEPWARETSTANDWDMRAGLAIARLTAEEQLTARNILLRLVRVGDRGEKDVSVSARIDDFSGKEASVISMLTQSGILRVERDDSGIKIVEFAKGLLDGWPELQSWVGNNREFLAWRQRLEAMLREWEGAGRVSGGLLRSASLVEAERFISARKESLTDRQIDFIQRSAKRRTRVRIAVAICASIVFVALVAAYTFGRTSTFQVYKILKDVPLTSAAASQTPVPLGADEPVIPNTRWAEALVKTNRISDAIEASKKFQNTDVLRASFDISVAEAILKQDPTDTKTAKYFWDDADRITQKSPNPIRKIFEVNRSAWESGPTSAINVANGIDNPALRTSAFTALIKVLIARKDDREISNVFDVWKKGTGATVQYNPYLTDGFVPNNPYADVVRASGSSKYPDAVDEEVIKGLTGSDLEAGLAARAETLGRNLTTEIAHQFLAKISDPQLRSKLNFALIATLAENRKIELAQTLFDESPKTVDNSLMAPSGAENAQREATGPATPVVSISLQLTSRERAVLAKAWEKEGDHSKAIALLEEEPAFPPVGKALVSASIADGIAENVQSLSRPEALARLREAENIARQIDQEAIRSAAYREIASHLAENNDIYDARLLADRCQTSDRIIAYAQILEAEYHQR
ncbi:hypothetical protein H7849_18005 [Alloacidobacterium dinghuense]|uniref:Novel STAND NTPase 1 domain-containing protein n=2 Tax=Alloacidobacterium dinghuense TaxID=2763107 RepID=A0A7G8BEM1_9BACT|nr:hypothetical protein [Alloacidobacterium dinghuense]QNI30991.1 hypothetical protein H7849_18005 [Alloacidobacterium dinghuense]